MLRKQNIDHLLRAAAGITNKNHFVMVGSGAVIATARHIPAAMMMTNEIDLYVEGDPEAADQIDAAIGEGSRFHISFKYYADGVAENTAMLPVDWKLRAEIYSVPGENVVALCPSPNDIAVAKMCAFREKDVDWLKHAITSGIAKPQIMQTLIKNSLPPNAPAQSEMNRRWTILLSAAQFALLKRAKKPLMSP